MTWIVLSFGLVIGSFLNVCIVRIPEKTFFSSARSQCPHCGEKIPFYLNIPMISWLLLRGKAKCCGGPISWVYPTVEALTGVLAVVLYWHFPFVEIKKVGFSWDPLEFIRFAHMAIFTALMITISFIDLKLQIIPDVISLPMLGCSVFWVAVHPHLTWQSSLFGVALGGGVLYLVGWLYYLIRKDYGMGFGDVKLLAAIGGWLGVEAIMPTLFIGSTFGAAVGILAIVFVKGGHMKTKIPFGPFLAVGAFIHMLYGTVLTEWLATV